jgi:hypothetical protein
LIPGEGQIAAGGGKTQLGLEFYESLALTVAIVKEFPLRRRTAGEDFG